MANKVTNENIREFNELYYICGTYAEVARRTGFSASTVKRYIIPGYKPVLKEDIIRFNEETDLPAFDVAATASKTLIELTTHTGAELNELTKLWEELEI